jgi:hypothetical protein
MLDIWPALPIFVSVHGKYEEINDNVLAALEKHDRVRGVEVDHLSDDELGDVVGAMQVTFPALTHLDIHSVGDMASFPERLLGGSAPNLQSLRLEYAACPALPKLLLSCPGLSTLYLFDISPSGHISSDAMIDCLSSLNRLEHLQIEISYSRPHPERANRRPPPLTRTVFPVLRILTLKGETVYLDQLLAHIEAPHLDGFHIGFLDPPIFDISRLSPCIGPTETFETFDEAYIRLRIVGLKVVLSSQKRTTSSKRLTMSLQWEDSRWELQELSLHPFNTFQPFNFCDVKGRFLPSRVEAMGNLPWLQLVRLFIATKYMYLSQRLAVRVALALQELTGAGTTEVLPVVRNIFVERLGSSGAVQEAIGQFVAARQLLSGHPIDVQCWEGKE